MLNKDITPYRLTIKIAEAICASDESSANPTSKPCDDCYDAAKRLVPQVMVGGGLSPQNAVQPIIVDIRDSVTAYTSNEDLAKTDRAVVRAEIGYLATSNTVMPISLGDLINELISTMRITKSLAMEAILDLVQSEYIQLDQNTNVVSYTRASV